jgi:hypothetical protein
MGVHEPDKLQSTDARMSACITHMLMFQSHRPLNLKRRQNNLLHLAWRQPLQQSSGRLKPLNLVEKEHVLLLLRMEFVLEFVGAQLDEQRAANVVPLELQRKVYKS